MKSSLREHARVLKPLGKLGVLTNHKTNSLFKELIVEIVSRMAKISFTRCLEEQLKELFTIVQNQLMYHDFVQMFIGLRG